MADNTIKIGGELESMATGKIVAAASAIKDKSRNKTQEAINGDVEAAIAEQSAQFDALSEETGSAVASASESARQAEQYLADLQEAITDLPDGQSVSAQVAVNQTDIAGLKSNIVVDLSVRYTASYANLSAALTALDSDTATDAAAIKKGGMSIKFINSTTYKYEQWNLKSSSWSTNTPDWVSVTDSPTQGTTSYKEVKVDAASHVLSALDSEDVQQEFLKHRFHKQVVFDRNISSPTITGINDEINTINGKLENQKGYEITQSDEYIKVIVDSNNKILEAVKKDGTRVFFTEIEGKTIDSIKQDVDELKTLDGFKIEDSLSYVSAFVDKDGKILEAVKKDGTRVFFTEIEGKTIDSIKQNIEELQSQGNSQFRDKVIAFYGDSITAQYNFTNNDQEYPFGAITDRGWEGWQSMVSKHYHFSACHIRGFGGQGYNWNTGGDGSHGGSLGFARANGSTQSYASSVGGVAPTLDNYQDLGVVVPSGTTPFRGCFCSWNRITTQFPASIKDNIDIIIIMGATNDADNSTEATFVANDITDPEWAASSYYATYGGDYNITTLEGGIASAIMKFQAWMPNATIVLATPLSGRGGADGKLNMGRASELSKSIRVRDVAKYLSIPLIDINARCCINGLNRTSYIYIDNNGAISNDSVHPFNPNGQKALAEAMIGGLTSIFLKNNN